MLWKVILVYLLVDFFFFLILAGFHYMLEPKHLNIFSFPLVSELPWHSQSFYRTCVYDFSKLFSNWVLAICVMGKSRFSLGCYGEKKISVTYLKNFQTWYVFCVQHVFSFSSFIIKTPFFGQLYFIISVLRELKNIGHYPQHKA